MDRLARTPLIFLILILLPLSIHPQTIQIHDITNNAGALILKRGEGKIVAGYDRLLHVIDFEKFEISISIIENVINQMHNSTSDFSQIIKMKIREIKFILSTLYPKSNRSKRSINILGSTIKLITGNLDAEDLKVINNNLDELRKTGNTFIKQNNRQIRINSKFENRLDLLNKDIRDHQNTLNTIMENDNYLIFENQKIAITFQLDTFLEHLKSIEYAILLSKVNIISKFILTPKEIEVILQEIKDQGLEIQHLDDASNFLTTTTLFKGSSIIICVNIPRFQPTTYEKVIIEPLPIFNHSVKIAYNKVFINDKQILAINSECRENNKITICERRQLLEISDSLCEVPLLNGRHGQCPLSEKPPSTETRIIAPGTLLIITAHQGVIINGTCGITPRTLTGIHFVTFHNCSLYIKNELFENYEIKFDHPSVLPVQLTNIKTLHVERHVNLSELHELNLKNRQHLETVDMTYQLGFGSFGTVIILMVILLAIGITKYWRKVKSADCSGRAISKGGRVKDATSPTPSNIVSPEPGGPVRANTQVAWSARSNMGTHQSTTSVIAKPRNAEPTMDPTGVVSLTGAR
ncbi:uncharacterized protein LOC129745546 [Uranotaenia lowii]|uniref:uncharacterized protein LOC129745546 n=1 Tax=Uranotaenia lowii TaxID=190385 RepID=UPI0024789540|nr:uncharacterized protein LOC129745546 [Uranotaenia lowii]